jgi:hypothetical protein
LGQLCAVAPLSEQRIEPSHDLVASFPDRQADQTERSDRRGYTVIEETSRIELCSQYVPVGSFVGKSPCDGQTDNLKAKTDANGKFVIENVPVGDYVGFAVQDVVQGGWYIFWGPQLSRILGITNGQITLNVKEGETVDLGRLGIGS